MKTPYDILKRDAAGEWLWLDAVADLATAQTRVQILASEAPGEYIVFDQRSCREVFRLK